MLNWVACTTIWDQVGVYGPAETGVLLMSRPSFITKYQVNVYVPWDSLKPCHCPLNRLLPKAMWMSGLPPELMLMFLPCAAAKDYNDVLVPCCSREPCWCLRYILPLEPMLRSVAYVEVKDHVDISDQCCHQKPSGCPRPVCPLTVKKAAFEVVSMTEDSQFRKRNRRLLWQPLPSNSHTPKNCNSLDVIWMLK